MTKVFGGKMKMKNKTIMHDDKPNMQIITSFLDLDYYKLTMGNFVFKRYPDVPVKYAFKNRTTKVRLAEVIAEDELRKELDSAQTLKPTEQELEYLRGLKSNDSRLFGEDYLQFLRTVQLPGYDLKKENGDFKIEFSGPWSTAIYWETLALSIVNELYYRNLMKGMTEEQVEKVYETGIRNLEEKIKLFEQYPDIRFIEFGTRRRFSKQWQEYVVQLFKEKIPKLMIGTSNVYLAMKTGLAPKGTMAHELFMIMSCIMHGSDDEIRASHNHVLREWWDEYGPGLSIALSDTYGSPFFFDDMTKEQARNYIGLRQDSGSPSSFGRQQLRFYEKWGIDPRKKLFVPSDGLTPTAIVGIQNEFRSKIISVYGWGTNATNDMGLLTLSQVVKAAEANGYGTVKLSDNPAKSMGRPEDVKRFMRIFDYDPDAYKAEECVY